MKHNDFLKNKANEINGFKYDLVIGSIKCYTRDNPVTNNTLCKSYKLSGVMLRDIVREARRKKIPIGSDSKGYFLCKDKDDLLHTLDHLKSRSFSMLETISCMEKIFNETYQIGMFDADNLFGEINKSVTEEKSGGKKFV